MSEINLDEIVGELEPHKVVIAGRTFWANPDPSVSLLWNMSKLGDTDADNAMEAMRALLVEIFDEDHATEILQLCGMKRVAALLEALSEAYAAEGKDSGSSRTSPRTGGRSKPTAGASTKSISAKRASAQNGSGAALSHA